MAAQRSALDERRWREPLLVGDATASKTMEPPPSAALQASAVALSNRRQETTLSLQFTARLAKSATGTFGLQVRPFDIRAGSSGCVGSLLSGTFTIFEVAAVDEGGPAEAAGVQALDVLLEVAGTSVRNAGPDELVAALQNAAPGESWRFIRVKTQGDGVVEPPAKERMETVLRAYQETAATLVQSRWRARKSREAMRAHLAQEQQQRSVQAASAEKLLQLSDGLRAGFGDEQQSGGGASKKRSPQKQKKRRPKAAAALVYHRPLAKKATAAAAAAAAEQPPESPQQAARRAARRAALQQRCVTVAQVTLAVSPRVRPGQAAEELPSPVASLDSASEFGDAADIIEQVRRLRGEAPLPHPSGSSSPSGSVSPRSPRAVWGDAPTDSSPRAGGNKGKAKVAKVARGAGFLQTTRSAAARAEEQTAVALRQKQVQSQSRQKTVAERGRGRSALSSPERSGGGGASFRSAAQTAQAARRLHSPTRIDQSVKRLSSPKHTHARSLVRTASDDPAQRRAFVGGQARASQPDLSAFSSLADEAEEAAASGKQTRRQKKKEAHAKNLALSAELMHARHEEAEHRKTLRRDAVLLQREQQKDAHILAANRVAGRLMSPKRGDPSPRLLSPTRSAARRAEAVAEQLAWIGKGGPSSGSKPTHHDAPGPHYDPTRHTDMSYTSANASRSSKQGTFGPAKAKDNRMSVDTHGRFFVAPELEDETKMATHTIVRKKSDIDQHISGLHQFGEDAKQKRKALSERHHASFYEAHRQKLESSFAGKIEQNPQSQAERIARLATPREALDDGFEEPSFKPELEGSFAAKGAGDEDDDNDDEGSGGRTQTRLAERLSSPRRVAAMAHEAWAAGQVTRRVCVHVPPTDPPGTMCRFCTPSTISDQHKCHDDVHNISVGHSGQLRWEAHEHLHDGESSIMEELGGFASKGHAEEHVVDLHGKTTQSHVHRQRQMSREAPLTTGVRRELLEQKGVLDKMSDEEFAKMLADMRRGKGDLHGQSMTAVSAVSAFKNSGEDRKQRLLASVSRMHAEPQKGLDKVDQKRLEKERQSALEHSFKPELSPRAKQSKAKAAMKAVTAFRASGEKVEHLTDEKLKVLMEETRKRLANSPEPPEPEPEPEQGEEVAELETPRTQATAALAAELGDGLAGDLDELEALEAAELNAEAEALQVADAAAGTDAGGLPEGIPDLSLIGRESPASPASETSENERDPLPEMAPSPVPRTSFAPAAERRASLVMTANKLDEMQAMLAEMKDEAAAPEPSAEDAAAAEAAKCVGMQAAVGARLKEDSVFGELGDLLGGGDGDYNEAASDSDDSGGIDLDALMSGH